MITCCKIMLQVFLFVTVAIPVFDAHLCGCKTVRACYIDMLNTLRDKDEEICIENVSIEMSTLMIYLKAVRQFCPDIVTVRERHHTYEGRPLFEVIVSENNHMKNKSIIIIDAGLRGGTDTTVLALVLLQQLIACTEYAEMISFIKWVILPSCNPDGMEYTRANNMRWKKNMRPSDDGLTFGVDLTRNFNHQWSACNKMLTSQFSLYYPGTGPATENETLFVQEILQRYKQKTKAYVSIRLHGHSILYPYSYTKRPLENPHDIKRYAYEIANKVNQRAGVIQTFINESIIGMNGSPRCGSSVDYAYDLGIQYSFEMRTFLGTESLIMAEFQELPKGYKESLLLGYLSGIKKLYDLVRSDHNQEKASFF